MKYWEIVADRLSKAGWSWVVHLRLIRLFGCFSRQMRTASNLKESRMMTVIEIKPHRNSWKFLKHFCTTSAGGVSSKATSSRFTGTDDL
jgi:hypothetical protein